MLAGAFQERKLVVTGGDSINFGGDTMAKCPSAGDMGSFDEVEISAKTSENNVPR